MANGQAALMHPDKLDVQISVRQTLATHTTAIDLKLDKLNELVIKAQQEAKVCKTSCYWVPEGLY